MSRIMPIYRKSEKKNPLVGDVSIEELTSDYEGSSSSWVLRGGRWTAVL